MPRDPEGRSVAVHTRASLLQDVRVDNDEMSDMPRKDGPEEPGSLFGRGAGAGDDGRGV